ncbi:unnamed protein product [Durusdinium trenchii]|uniref:Uncharacterized protein n=1 Tax=Durusdinium trenchii TaxID=1381693 RepID=A0ABP0QUB7_9DINO
MAYLRLGGNGVFALGHLHRADLLFFFPGFESVPSGLAFAVTAPGSYGFIGLFALSGALELGLWTESDDKEPSNFGDPVGFNQYTQEMRERELNNGRFAMFAAIGIIAAELYTGKDAVEQFGL